MQLFKNCNLLNISPCLVLFVYFLIFAEHLSLLLPNTSYFLQPSFTKFDLKTDLIFKAIVLQSDIKYRFHKLSCGHHLVLSETQIKYLTSMKRIKPLHFVRTHTAIGGSELLLKIAWKRTTPKQKAPRPAMKIP